LVNAISALARVSDFSDAGRLERKDTADPPVAPFGVRERLRLKGQINNLYGCQVGLAGWLALGRRCLVALQNPYAERQESEWKPCASRR
jgi:hypothetical protein